MVRTGIVKLKKGDMLRVCFETPNIAPAAGAARAVFCPSMSC